MVLWRRHFVLSILREWLLFGDRALWRTVVDNNLVQNQGILSQLDFKSFIMFILGFIKV
ncbi:hypothetical protein FD47_GL002181 [Lentilactobacillus parafarraginis DSM 18390 = JCM 14109]|uniref:Uncharacterized protein n=1 Tax=Lentilactobacillus parafarraginis DSM 18390 = JCM 14109 TaxID=1423786 RepID=A0A0R1YH38_9LACO|nr:hypothetical protein FD47_GL002181 [Lentilactobacillus parafarraginis DSM 18390 = JCM 14109]